MKDSLDLAFGVLQKKLRLHRFPTVSKTKTKTSANKANFGGKPKPLSAAEPVSTVAAVGGTESVVILF